MTQSSPAKNLKVPPTAARPEPPKWAVEHFFDTLGKFPAILGRGLDSLAKVPVLGAVVWFFSSVWLGLLWIALIGLYVAIGSGVSSIRAYFDMTDLEFFDAWPMQLLLWLMCTTLIIVTLRRIRLTLFKAGVWTVHIGILVLVLGCCIYFGNKFEGMTRIFLHKSSEAIYDVTERLLYVYKFNPDRSLGDPVMIPLPRLPIYNDRLKQTNAPLSRPVPAADLAKLDPKLAGVPVTITGYYSEASFTRNRWIPGLPTDDVHMRGIGFTLRTAGPENSSKVHWLVNTPAGRVADSGDFAFEYLYLPTAKQLDPLKAQFRSQEGVTVTIPKLNFSKTYAITTDDPIKIEGTPYTIQPLEADPMRPLITPGYENASSDGLWIEVLREDPDGKKIVFDRDVLSRYPEVSSDFTLDTGQRRRVRGGLLDSDIELVYHNASVDHTWIVEEKPGQFLILHRAVGGRLDTVPIAMGQEAQVDIGSGVSAIVGLAGETNNAIEANMAFLVPPFQREKKTSVGDWISNGALELSVGAGADAKTCYVPFTPFADTTSKIGHKPEPVEIPGVGTFGFVLSTTRRPLPGVVTLDNFEFHTQGNTPVPKDYVSHISITSPDGTSEKLDAQLNDPAMYKGLAFSQAQWDGNPNAKDEDRHTVLLVGNRPGVHVMIAGCGLMLLGVLFAFYIKPFLLNLKKVELQNWNAEGRS